MHFDYTTAKTHLFPREPELEPLVGLSQQPFLYTPNSGTLSSARRRVYVSTPVSIFARCAVRSLPYLRYECSRCQCTEGWLRLHAQASNCERIVAPCYCDYE